MARRRFSTMMLDAFALFALLPAIVGVYGRATRVNPVTACGTSSRQSAGAPRYHGQRDVGGAIPAAIDALRRWTEVRV